MVGYSPANTPHLAPALELDSALIDFSTNLSSKGLPSIVNSEEDLNCLISAFEQDLRGLDLWQYYVLEPSREKKSVAASLESGDITPWTGPDIRGKAVTELAEILRSEQKILGLGLLESRFGPRVEGSVSAGLVKAAFIDIQEIDALAEAWGRIIDIVNVPLYKEWEDDTRAALDNIRNRAQYTRLDAHGPKLGEISKQ